MADIEHVQTPDLGQFIEWLERQGADATVALDLDLHSDRGDYAQVAISPGESRASELAEHLRGRLDTRMYGWKGGDYTVGLGCAVFVANWGDMGPRLGVLGDQVVLVGDGWDVR